MWTPFYEVVVHVLAPFTCLWLRELHVQYSIMLAINGNE